jgi:hypothetical protein
VITLDLPSPDQLRGRWAAFAAICASRGWGDSAFATREDGAVRWHYDDGGGNWGDLVRLDGGRAVLLGNDHEYSETYFREAAEFFGEEETDLLAGAPAWWEAPVVAAMAREQWVGFAYGYDGTWTRAEYDGDDGFESLGHVAVDQQRCLDLCTQFASKAPGLDGREPAREDVEALIAADADVTAELLERVVPGWDVEAGLVMGRAFLED